MAKIERLSWAWAEHVFLDPDRFPDDESAMIRAKYRVEGQDEVLIVLAHWSEPMRDATVEAMMLKKMDEEAQWAADHPNEGIHGHLVCD